MDTKYQIQYSRQMKLQDIGQEGQKKIFNSRVGIFGVGGLGTWSALLCSQMGIGYLRLVDRDVVELSNLPRTPIFTQESIDLPKAEESSKSLLKINPKLKIDTFATNIDESTINELIDGLDIVIDGLDSFHTRYIVNQACYKKKIPYIFAGGLAMHANLSTFTYNDGPCLNCIFSDINDENLPTCETTGVHTSLLAITSSIQVAECIKIITGAKPQLQGKIAYFDLINYEIDHIDIKKNKNCAICGMTEQPMYKPKEDHRIVELCGDQSYMVVPKPRVVFDISKIGKELKKEYEIVKQGHLGLTFNFDNNATVSIFKGGNFLIRGVSTKSEVDVITLKISQYLN